VRPDPTGWTGAGPDKGTARQAALPRWDSALPHTGSVLQPLLVFWGFLLPSGSDAANSKVFYWTSSSSSADPSSPGKRQGKPSPKLPGRTLIRLLLPGRTLIRPGTSCGRPTQRGWVRPQGSSNPLGQTAAGNVFTKATLKALSATIELYS